MFKAIRMKHIALTLACFLGLSLSAQNPTIQLTQVGSGFSSVTNLANCGDGRLFVVEQSGRIRFFDPYNAGASTTFLDIQSRVGDNGNERGLLGLAFAPDYSTTGKFYVNYTNNSGNTVISRFSVSANPNSADVNSEEILLTITQPYSNHNGGNIQFGPDGYLYIGMGDGGSGGDPQNYAQNRQSFLGKILRLDVSTSTGYAIPADNPFTTANDPGNTTLDEIWAIGVRNPWKYSFDRETGDLWIADVGQNVYEEVNFQAAGTPAGENYGWRCYESNTTYNTSGCAGASNYHFPIFEYAHSSSNGCSITGGYVCRGIISDNLVGRYLTTDYCSGRIWSILNEGNNVFSTIDHGQFTTNSYTTFGEDIYGEVYLARQSGIILRVGASNSNPVASIEEPASTQICPGQTLELMGAYNPLLSYQWIKDGEDLLGETDYILSTQEAGSYTLRVTRNSDNANTTSDAIIVSLAPAPPALTLSADFNELCEDAAFAFTLTGTPSGGTYSGIGVQDGNFNPFQLGAGEYEVAYNFTTAEGCESDPAYTTITIYPLPEVSLSGIEESYCVDTEILVSPVLSPQGGTFYGTGVSNGTFSPSLAGVGEFILNYTYADEFSCSNTASFTVVVDACLSSLEEGMATFQLIPNPASDYIRLEGNFSVNSKADLRMYNILGSLVKEEKIQSETTVLSIVDLAPGAYTVIVTVDGNSYSSKLIKH